MHTALQNPWIDPSLPMQSQHVEREEPTDETFEQIALRMHAEIADIVRTVASPRVIPRRNAIDEFAIDAADMDIVGIDRRPTAYWRNSAYGEAAGLLPAQRAINAAHATIVAPEDGRPYWRNRA